MTLSDNIWWTRKARIQTEKRLLSNSFQAQILLLWYSFFSVFAAIYYLQVERPDALVNVGWIAFSILTLTVSGFINGLSFKERAALVKECYETLNGIYIQARIVEKALGFSRGQNPESDRMKPGCPEGAQTTQDESEDGRETANHKSIESIGREFQQVLKVCENHTDSDFRAALCEAHLTEPRERLTKHPTQYTWLVFWLERLARVVLFSLYVLLPVGIFVGIGLL
tara:strand:+ start:329 stop:1006 length:678 start_codon:yes stop_codon:yes gene_type:complete